LAILSLSIFSDRIVGQTMPTTHLIKEYPVTLGQTTVRLRVTRAQGRSAHCFLIIHDDENTATEATREHIQSAGGTMIELDSGGRRHLVFTMADGQTVTVDPNRLFTDAGLRRDLQRQNPGRSYGDDPAILREVKKLRRQVLTLLKTYRCNPVIAAHNNQDEHAVDSPEERGFSILSYAEGGREVKLGNTRRRPGNPSRVVGEDPDNFFIVTNPRDFERLRGRYNVVLQTRRNDSTAPGGRGPDDDGSLSVMLKTKRYINLEVQSGDKEKQKAMLADLERVLRGKKLQKQH